jgi:hypothetical protein
MTIESFSPLPLNVFGTWVTLLDPSDVPAEMSPSLGGHGIFPWRRAYAPGIGAAISGAGRHAASVLTHNYTFSS